MNEQTIWQQLAAPLGPGSIKKRKQEYKDKKTGEMKSFEVSYIDARTVIERLNDVVPGDWHFENELVSMPCQASNGKWVIKGRLTVNGCVHEDYGMNDNEDAFDPPKSAVSDALKRCGVHFGIGLELYHGHAPKAERGPSTNVKPQNAPQKPAQAATEPSGVDQTTGEIASDLLPPVDKAMADMDGKELYQIQHNAYTALNMNHANHFENRWKKRYAVKNLRDIPGTFGDFMTVMALEDAEQEKVA